MAELRNEGPGGSAGDAAAGDLEKTVDGNFRRAFGCRGAAFVQ
jgi:hypothetical protein